MFNIVLFSVYSLRFVLIPIISYFICVYILKPAFNLVYMIIHYHRFPSYPKHFLFGHLKVIRPNFPFQSDMSSISRNIHEMATRIVNFNPNRCLSAVWISLYPIILASDNKAVEMVLDKKNLRKPYFYRFMGLGNGLITIEPEYWKVRRKLIEPFFSTKKLKDHVETMYTVAESFSRQLDVQVGETVNLESQIHSSTLDIILKTAASIPLDDLIEDKKIFLAAVSNLEPNSVKRAAHPIYYFDWLFKFFEFGQFYFKTIDVIDKCIEKILDRRNQLWQSSPSNASGDFLDLLEVNVDGQTLHNELKTIIGAGHETTAVGLRWILFNLGNHLDEQQKLYQEIIENFPDETQVNDVDRINKCSYLDQCLKESLRLNPPVHGVTRLLDDHVSVDGKVLLKGSIVCVLIDTTHRDPSVYPDPEKYDPDRWSPENASKIPKESFIPFGYGPRVCVGWRYAMLELKIYTISIIRKFSIKSTRKHGSVPFKSEITLKPVLPLEVILTPRNSN